MSDTVELGDRVKCKITGFQGIVTSYAKCLTGCDRITVQPPVDKDGKHPDPLWFDANAVEIIEKNKVKLEDVRGKVKGGPPSKGRP